MENGKKKGSVVGIAVLLFFAACSVQNNYPTLSFFFDGVPDPEEIKQAAIADSLNSLTITDSSAFLTQKATTDFFIHLPFLEKKCADCHNKGLMGSLNQPMPGLCYQCHKDFGTQYSFIHGPAAGGFCTECHDPHKSKEEKLLKRTGQDMCLHCHEADQVYGNDFHDNEDETDCNSCHNPHGSNNHSMLELGTCYQCHENFNDKYPVLHGPVASGNCSICHVPHHTGEEKLLVRMGRELCLDCHDALRLLAAETHEGIDDADCIDCHNPHGGDDRFMFN